jgi:hypothetical protein
MPADLDASRIDAIVQRVADQLPGDWLLIGGGLAALWFDSRRVTEDIDLVGIDGTGAERLSLLGLAQDLGLPVEALNSAADFFVHRITDWREQVEVFRVGRSGRVLRPTPTLFLLLKLRRLSTRDLDDCLRLLERCRAEGLGVDAARVVADLDALPATNDSALAVRRSELRQAILAV